MIRLRTLVTRLRCIQRFFVFELGKEQATWFGKIPRSLTCPSVQLRSKMNCSFQEKSENKSFLCTALQERGWQVSDNRFARLCESSYLARISNAKMARYILNIRSGRTRPIRMNGRLRILPGTSSLKRKFLRMGGDFAISVGNGEVTDGNSHYHATTSFPRNTGAVAA